MAKKKPKKITKEQFDSWSPEKQQRALNDRRTRIRIEDKALPKEWLERRQRARWNRTPITPGSGTTYGDLEKQRKYLEPLTFGEGDRQLSDRTANLAGLQQASNDWFSEYRKQIGDANNAASQAAQATVQGGQNMITGITNQANIDRDMVARQLRDRAAQLGQVSSAPEFEQLANAARDTRAQQLASSNQAMNAGAAAASQEAASRVVSAGLADQANRDSNRRREIALEQDKKDYGSKKDAWRAKFIDDAIAEARKQVLEDRAFGATQADREADNARADKSLSIQERRLREQRRAARERERLAREREARQAAGGGRSSGGGSKPKPATPKETREIAQKIRTAVNLVRYMKAAGKDKNGVKYTTSSIRAALAKKGTDADVVNSAMDIVYLGGIGRVNRSRWRKAGYNPRSFGQPFQKGR